MDSTDNMRLSEQRFSVILRPPTPVDECLGSNFFKDKKLLKFYQDRFRIKLG